MNLKLFQKILSLIIIFSLIFGLFNFVFTNQVNAQTSAGSMVGKAVAAGSACFLASKAEGFVAGMLTRTEAIPEGAATKVSDMTSVPVIDNSGIKNAKSVETSNALTKSKDCIRDVVAKILLDWIADETVKWVQGGGQPGYITNWGNFAEDAINVGIGEVVQDTKLAALCSPFKMPIINIALLPEKRFQQRIGCTLDRIVGNIDNFYNDFAQGGWVAYQESLYPENNYYGTIINIQDEMNRKSAEKKESALNEAISGKGFLSVRQCLEYNQEGLDECIASGGGQSECEAAACVKEEIVTPGDAVGTAVGSAFASSDAQWAQNIHSWVAAIINAAINRLMKEGLSAATGAAKKLYFKGGSSSSYYSGGSGDSDPMAGANDPKAIREQARKDMIDHMKNVVSDLTKIRTNKVEARVNAQNTLTALQNMKTMTCSPPVTTDEITNAQNVVNKLTNDLANIDILIVQINDFITYATNIPEANLEAEFTTMQERYQDLSAKAGAYGTVLQSVDEKNAKKAEYDAIQQRQLTTCI